MFRYATSIIILSRVLSRSPERSEGAAKELAKNLDSSSTFGGLRMTKGESLRGQARSNLKKVALYIYRKNRGKTVCRVRLDAPSLLSNCRGTVHRALTPSFALFIAI